MEWLTNIIQNPGSIAHLVFAFFTEKGRLQTSFFVGPRIIRTFAGLILGRLGLYGPYSLDYFDNHQGDSIPSCLLSPSVGK